MLTRVSPSLAISNCGTSVRWFATQAACTSTFCWSRLPVSAAKAIGFLLPTGVARTIWRLIVSWIPAWTKRHLWISPAGTVICG